MNKVYIGSMNPIKIQATKNILEPLGFTVVATEVDSGVSKQPLTDEETMQGAKNRALQLPNDGLRIGLEAGVELHFDTLFLVNWGVLIDQIGQVCWAGGTRIPLPEEIKRALLMEKIELSEAMNIYFSEKNINHREGAIGYFTDLFVCRIDIFEHIVKLLIGQYYNLNKRRKDK